MDRESKLEKEGQFAKLLMLIFFILFYFFWWKFILIFSVLFHTLQFKILGVGEIYTFIH